MPERMWPEWIKRSLLTVTPRDQQMSPQGLRRRQRVAVVVGVIGAALLAVSLRLEPGNTWFYPATFALAGVWALGAFASGQLHLGRFADGRRPIIEPLALGFTMAGIFVLGALVVREIDPLARQVANVLSFASEGTLTLLIVITFVNGVAEELFFRGGLYAAITRRPVLWTTVLYVVATAATGNIMLTFAAALLGTVVGLQRRASGGVLAPILTHCSWSVTMLLALPPIFGLR